MKTHTWVFLVWGIRYPTWSWLVVRLAIPQYTNTPSPDEWRLFTPAIVPLHHRNTVGKDCHLSCGRTGEIMRTAYKTLFLDDQLYNEPHYRTSLLQYPVSPIAYLFVCTNLLLELFPGDLWACNAAHGQSTIIEQLSNNQGPHTSVVCGHSCMCMRHACARITLRGRTQPRTQ